MKANSLRELLVEELKDLYDAEHQLIKALPKMAEAASSEDLRAAIEEHLEKTEQQAERLKQVFSQLDESPKAQKCKGMEGLIKEGTDIIKEDDMDPEVKDASSTMRSRAMVASEPGRTCWVRTRWPPCSSKRLKRRKGLTRP